METELIFERDFAKMIYDRKIDYKLNDIPNTKGIYCMWWKKSFINLSHPYWKLFYNSDPCMFIEEFTKTLIHENMHGEIGKVNYWGTCFDEGEEIIAQIMANQINGFEDPITL